MNNLPLSQAKDIDLRLSQVAIERAALRARELAVQTGTDLIVSQDGVIQRINAELLRSDAQIQEPRPPYKHEP